MVCEVRLRITRHQERRNAVREAVKLQQYRSIQHAEDAAEYYFKGLRSSKAF